MDNEIIFTNGNSRETYFTVHNIKKAHNTSKGKGIKVGVIDWLFGMNNNKSLFAGYADITGVPQHLFENEGHGLWMVTTLREIAPECEIYAINSTLYSEYGEIDRIGFFEKSILWAIEYKLDVLTYSNAAFFGDDRVRANNAVKSAAQNGLITTFIHNDSEYNILHLPVYERYLNKTNSGEQILSGDDMPFFSNSSMSVVLAGFIAILKSIKKSLTREECVDLLVSTSYEITQESDNWYELNPCQHVVDIGKAVELLRGVVNE